MEEENDLQKQPPVPSSASSNPPVAPVAQPAGAPFAAPQADQTAAAEAQGPVDPLPEMVIHPIRTYKGDINQTVNEDKITTAKILMAEQRQREKQKQVVPETSVKKPRNVLALVFGIIFLAGAVGVLGYFGYTQFIARVPSITIQQGNAFLFVFDREEFVNVTAQSRPQIYEEVTSVLADAQNEKPGTYTDIVFYKVDEASETNVRISSAEFFDLYGIRLPTNIGRSISKDFTYGLYRTENSVEPFLVLGLADFANAYDSMFDWESTLALDMRDFFPNLANLFDVSKVTGLSGMSLATTTASSTASSTGGLMATTSGAVPVSATSTAVVVSGTPVSAATSSGTATTVAPVDFQAQLEQERIARETINRSVQFVDLVLANKDTRTIRDTGGTPFFFYTFIDKDKILFAQDSKLISEIVRKIREKQLIR